MYAVFASGGQQHKVTSGQIIKVAKLDAEPGSKITFDQILLTSDGEKSSIGAPYVAGSSVVVEVVGHGRGKKIKIIKTKRRKNSQKQMGHRRDHTEIKILEVK
ncbi:MAG: 50S ribosomal protein L21 [Thiotrichales bacterium]|nr:MAG: 50S ribosomal protein L21 [Thiotrichales bacterium]